jgi:poly(A) polymerase
MQGLHLVDDKLMVPKADDVRVLAPTPSEILATAALEAYIDKEAPLATSGRHTTALKKLHGLFREWTGTVGSPPFHMFVSGSYKMGVHTEDADIDVVFVVPDTLPRTRVFTDFLRFMQGRPDVSGLQPLPDARVPIIGLALDGQEFDIMTCHVPSMHMHTLHDGCRALPTRELLLDTYDWMNGADEASILSFSGPRVTEIVLRAAPEERKRDFLLALRYLRLWAQRRAIYSNKCGYFGGVNLSLLTCFVALRRPAAVAAALVGHVFAFFAGWRWSKATTVAFIDDTTRCPAWLRSFEWSPVRTDAMVVLTPCFPRTNSMFSASDYTRNILQNEFRRGSRYFGAGLQGGWAQAAATGGDVAAAVSFLGAVCRPYPGLACCPRFVRVTITTEDTPVGRTWQGYVEAQIRYLVWYMSRQDLAVKTFRYIPVWSTTTATTPCTRSRSTFVTAEDDGKIRTYLVKGSLEAALTYFRQQHVDHGRGPLRPKTTLITAEFAGGASIPDDVFSTWSRAQLASSDAQECRDQARLALAEEVDLVPAAPEAACPDKGPCAEQPPISACSHAAPSVIPEVSTLCAEALLPACMRRLAAITHDLGGVCSSTGVRSAKPLELESRSRSGSFGSCTSRPPPLLDLTRLEERREMFRAGGRPDSRKRRVLAEGGFASRWPSMPGGPYRTKTRRMGPEEENDSSRYGPHKYVRVRVGPGKVLWAPPYDMYVGPPWGPLRCPNPLLEPPSVGTDFAEHEEYLLRVAESDGSARNELKQTKGKTLACWCPDEASCHVRVLRRVCQHLSK